MGAPELGLEIRDNKDLYASKNKANQQSVVSEDPATTSLHKASRTSSPIPKPRPHPFQTRQGIPELMKLRHYAVPPESCTREDERILGYSQVRKSLAT